MNTEPADPNADPTLHQGQPDETGLPNAPEQPPARPNQSREASEAEIEKAVQDALLNRITEIDGFPLYPETLASDALLRDAKSQLYIGVSHSKVANVELELGKYLLIHSFDLTDDAQLSEISKLVLDEDAFRVRVLQTLSKFDGDHNSMLLFVVDRIFKNSVTKMRVIPKKERPQASLEEIHRKTSGLPNQ